MYVKKYSVYLKPWNKTRKNYTISSLSLIVSWGNMFELYTY